MIPVAAIVLCGGMSSRMGRPKAWLPFGPERMLTRVVRVVSEVARPIVVVAAQGQELSELSAEILRAVDPVAGRGPLQGLAAGLEALPDSVEWVFATATDVPFLKPVWVGKLLSLAGEHDVVMPRIGGFHQPLAALYRRSVVLPVVENLLGQDRLRPVFLVEECRTRIVEEAEMREVDPQLDSLRNMNTPEDYQAALMEAGFGRPCIKVELFGVPRIKAGLARIECHAFDVGEALDALAKAAPALAGSVITDQRVHPAYCLNINGDRFVTEPREILVEGDELLLLAADIGG